MPWRGVAPIQLVILLVGGVMVLTASGIVLVTVIAVVRDVPIVVPQELAVVCISSLTALGGLLTPNTGLVSSRRAERAGQAAAAAVLEHDGLEDLAREVRGEDRRR